jgi:hypothetical protein
MCCKKEKMHLTQRAERGVNSLSFWIPPVFPLPADSADPLPSVDSQEGCVFEKKFPRRSSVRAKGYLAVIVSLLLLQASITPAGAPAVVGTIKTKGNVQVNGMVVPGEGTLYAGDRIVTGKDTAASVALAGRDQVFVPEHTAAAIRPEGQRVRVVLEQGAVTVVSRAPQPVEVQAAGMRISASAGPALYEVAVHGNALQVLSRRGVTLVTAANRTIEVPEGMKLEATAAGPEPVDGLSAFDKVVLVTAAGIGIAGFAVGLAAFLRDKPEDCEVVGSATPFTISCQ